MPSTGNRTTCSELIYPFLTKNLKVKTSLEGSRERMWCLTIPGSRSKWKGHWKDKISKSHGWEILLMLLSFTSRGQADWYYPMEKTFRLATRPLTGDRIEALGGICWTRGLWKEKKCLCRESGGIYLNIRRLLTMSLIKIPRTYFFEPLKTVPSVTSTSPSHPKDLLPSTPGFFQKGHWHLFRARSPL